MPRLTPRTQYVGSCPVKRAVKSPTATLSTTLAFLLCAFLALLQKPVLQTHDIWGRNDERMDTPTKPSSYARLFQMTAFSVLCVIICFFQVFAGQPE